jgi:hypothetical protein
MWIKESRIFPESMEIAFYRLLKTCELHKLSGTVDRKLIKADYGYENQRNMIK